MLTHEFRNITSVTYGAGGYFFDGKVYIGGLSPEAGVMAVEPSTLRTTTVLNSYFGLPITLADDLVWVTPQGGNKSYLFFTSFFCAVEPDTPVPKLDRPLALPNGVWRWDPQEKVLLPVISRLDIAIPNGIRVSPDQKTLYITDSLSTHAGGCGLGGQGFAPTGGPNIYAYDLNDDILPINRRVFGLARTGYADGIHVDIAGRVWTAEGEGIVVRNAGGRVLGVFNAAAFGMEASKGMQIANFAIAENKLFVAAFDSLYMVELAQVVATGQC
jgi:gluconolactonase